MRFVSEVSDMSLQISIKRRNTINAYTRSRLNGEKNDFKK